MAGSMGTTRRHRRKPKAEPTQSMSDYYKAQLGWVPPEPRPFLTSANVMCGKCSQIKPGCDFEQPITPGQGCRACSA